MDLCPSHLQRIEATQVKECLVQQNISYAESNNRNFIVLTIQTMSTPKLFSKYLITLKIYCLLQNKYTYSVIKCIQSQTKCNCFNGQNSLVRHLSDKHKSQIVQIVQITQIHWSLPLSLIQIRYIKILNFKLPSKVYNTQEFTPILEDKKQQLLLLLTDTDKIICYILLI